MIRSLFVSMQDLNKGARRPANVPPAQIKKVGILGAGFMGAGIASVSAQAGLDVVLIDRDQESADKGKAHVHKTSDRSGQQGPRHRGASATPCWRASPRPPTTRAGWRAISSSRRCSRIAR